MSDEYFDKLRETVENARTDPNHTLDSVSEAIKQLEHQSGPLRAYLVDSQYNVFFSVAGQAKALKDVDIDKFWGDNGLSSDAKHIKLYCIEFCNEGSDERVAYITYDSHAIAIDIFSENASELLQSIGDTFFELRY